MFKKEQIREIGISGLLLAAVIWLGSALKTEQEENAALHEEMHQILKDQKEKNAESAKDWKNYSDMVVKLLIDK